MFKVVRITILLLVLCFVSLGTFLSYARSTDWNNTLRLTIYPINADGSTASANYIADLDVRQFNGVETFLAREVRRYGRSLERPVRVRLSSPIDEQPPALDEDGGPLAVMLWSLKMRWWASRVTNGKDRIAPDVRMFVRYHSPDTRLPLENSVGVRKGMYGIVNGYASRRLRGRNNVIIAHEFLHTLGASDKYDPVNGQPIAPDGIAEPDRRPLYPQRQAEIMGGRIALAADDAVIPKSLEYAVIGPLTATEIKLSR